MSLRNRGKGKPTMKKYFHLATGVSLILTLLVTISVFAQEGDATKGKELYYNHGCYGCHGYNGETGVRDLVGTNSPIIANLDTFLIYLRLRTDYTPLVPSTQMPAYPESALNDDDARDIFAYINTFVLNAPEVEDVPALQSILDSAGQALEQ
jgi:mono/diheme cytochrome c family protein